MRLFGYSVFVMMAFVAIALTSCISRGGAPTSSYGNIHFFGRDTCNGMSVSPGPVPKNIEIVLPDGSRIGEASTTRDNIASIIEATPRVIKDPRLGTYETFKTDGCEIIFLDGKFSRLEVREGVKIINLTNNKSVTLPASVSDIRKVFGKPTAVNIPKSQQP